MHNIDFCFLWMPFTSIYTPSLGLGILQTLLKQGGLSTWTYYANIELLSLNIMTEEEYQFFINTHSGEWLFTEAAFGKFTSNEMPYLLRSCREWQLNPTKAIPRLKEFRNKMTVYIEHVAERIITTNPKIIGASSIFFQHVASLAVLRRIKEKRPDIITIMGGSNCELPMGSSTHKHFPWVDYIAIGEADYTILPFTQLALKYGNNIPQEQLPAGIISPEHRDIGYPDTNWRSVTNDLNKVPEPDYADYFEQISAYGLEIKERVALLAETSRGCWWAANKQGCNFCSLLAAQDTYRVKSSKIVLEQLERLSKKYSFNSIEFTDRVIPEKHFTDFLPELAANDAPYPLFYETRVNRLNRERAVLLRKAGVKTLQLGIESLNDQILTLMNKGAKAWENLQALKFTTCEKMHPYWNLIYDIPGEDPKTYQESTELFTKLVHLPAPSGFIQLQYRRWSNFSNTEKGLTHHWRYKYLYPIAEAELADIAYIFEPNSNNDPEVLQQFGDIPSAKDSNIVNMNKVIQLWKKLQRRRKQVCLYAFTNPYGIRIIDTRPNFIRDEAGEYTLQEQYTSCTYTDKHAKILQACDAAPLTTDLYQEWGQTGRAFIAELIHKNLVVEVGDRIVGLALFDAYGITEQVLEAEQLTSSQPAIDGHKCKEERSNSCF